MESVLEQTLISNPQTKNFSRSLAAFYSSAVENNLPVALWRYPKSSQAQAIVDLSESAELSRIDFTQHTSGFAFSPFVDGGGKSTLLIKAHLFLDETGCHTLSGNWKTEQNKYRFLKDYHNLLYNKNNISAHWLTAPTTYLPAAICSKNEFCGLVDDAITYITATGIKKIVASRATETPLPASFNPVAAFEALCRRYQHAFISLISIPGVGTWIGASPELLLNLTQQTLRTVALAGTQARPTDIPLSQVRWGAKEIEEQALVSNYIREFFQDLGLRTFVENGPHTVSAGKMVHLQTGFQINLASPQLMRLANQILNDLHPTSAVCGMPKQEALSFILEREKYNRAFYSGFLGPVHINNQSHLFVNLRCMQLKERDAVLYVGAGITQDSVPEAEWDETILKSQTLLAVLQS